ncbi:MAG: hypothetical protein JW720_07920 [Sedimentisphaerales bacterium]|nr:hypothetical protein [Sedimentisphaerales bacterium]
MKRCILYALLTTVLLPGAAFAGEPNPSADMDRQLELRAMELEIAQRESEIKFKEEMAQLELEQRRLQIEQAHRKLNHFRHKPHPVFALLLIGCIVVRILTAVWVYGDINRRNAGSGIWVVIALVAGLFGVLTYAVVRLGDNGTKNRK